MESPPLLVSVETLCDFIQALDGEQRTIRVINSNALLMPVEAVLNLLDTSTREVLSNARQRKPFVPSDKTIAKLISEPHHLPSRGTLLRLFRDAPHQEVLRDLIDEGRKDYSWQPAHEWRALLTSRLFINQVPCDFWISIVRDAELLNAVDMHIDRGVTAQFQAYAKSPIVERVGCPTVRACLHARLDELRDEEITNDEITQHVIIADRVAVLMRMLAWMVADTVVDIWEMTVRDRMEEVTPLNSILPAIEPISGEWNNSTTCALEHLAKQAGWEQKQRAITFLGNLWARHDPDRNTEASSRIRLLRNWEQRKKGRPQFETLKSLAHAVTIEKARLSDEPFEGNEGYTWTQAVILRIGETLSLIRQGLVDVGMDAEHIIGIMDAYRCEYRFARDALGKPMTPP